MSTLIKELLALGAVPADTREADIFVAGTSGRVSVIEVYDKYENCLAQYERNEDNYPREQMRVFARKVANLIERKGLPQGPTSPAAQPRFVRPRR